MNNAPPATAELLLYNQQSYHPPMAPSITDLLGPPPSPRPPKTENEKMLNLEPFSPFCQQLVGERENCKNAISHYNNTNNPDVKITADKVYRVFSAILEQSGPEHSTTPTQAYLATLDIMSTLTLPLCVTTGTISPSVMMSI